MSSIAKIVMKEPYQNNHMLSPAPLGDAALCGSQILVVLLYRITLHLRYLIAVPHPLTLLGWV